MHWQLFLLVLIFLTLLTVVTLTALWVLSRKLRSDSKQIENLQLMVKDLVHLAAAKDLSAYATLQQIPTQQMMSETPRLQPFSPNEEVKKSDLSDVIDPDIFKEFGMEY